VTLGLHDPPSNFPKPGKAGKDENLLVEVQISDFPAKKCFGEQAAIPLTELKAQGAIWVFHHLPWVQLSFFAYSSPALSQRRYVMVLPLLLFKDW
jgi:hypothetical protein